MDSDVLGRLIDQHAAALELYDAGADFVYVPRLHSAADLARVIVAGADDGLAELREGAIAELKDRREVLA